MMSFRLTNFVFCHPCIEVSSVVANRCADFDEWGRSLGSPVNECLAWRT